MRMLRALVLVAGGSLVGLGLAAPLTGVPAAVAAAPAPVHIGECPPGTVPGPGNDNPVWTDDNVAVYAGGDLTLAPNVAEVEGLVVVKGDMTVTKSSGRVNIGWVGVGSSVVPTPGSVMLAVGGRLAVQGTTVVDVGHGAAGAAGGAQGGSVLVGGATSPDYVTDGRNFELNGGTLTQGMAGAATSAWGGMGATLTTESAQMQARADTGTASVSGATLTLTAVDPSASPQVFTVAGTALAATSAVVFDGFSAVPASAPIIVNVTGSAPVTWAPNYFGDESGARLDDPASPRFGQFASQVMWNFTDSTAVHLAGSSQILGSVLVPSTGTPGIPTLRVTASTNGRLYTNGSILMDGLGNEHHNYPWVAPPFDCVPEPPAPTDTGGLTITKTVSPEDAALLPDGTVFHGTVTCTGPSGSVGEVVQEWTVRPGESTTVAGLPVGATCTAEESLISGRQVAPPVSGTLPPTRRSTGLTWEAPRWQPNPPTVIVPAAGAPAVGLTVTNTIARGAFTIQKEVVGDGAPDVTFTGTWACTFHGRDAGAGTWQLTGGHTTAPITAPIGAVCTVREDTAQNPGSGIWEPGVVTPSTVTITTASATRPVRVVVQNRFIPAAELGGFRIVKTVTNPSDVTFTGPFTGTWSCSADGLPTVSGAWTLQAGQSVTVADIPTGARCAVTETRPHNPSGGTWAVPEIDPATFTVGTSPTMVNVHNRLDATPGEPGEPGEPEQPGGPGPSVNTGGTISDGHGADTAPWTFAALAATGLAVGGIAAVRRRSRRGRP